MHDIIIAPTPYVTISFHSKMWFLGSYLPTFMPDVTLFTLFFFDGSPKVRAFEIDLKHANTQPGITFEAFTVIRSNKEHVLVCVR